MRTAFVINSLSTGGAERNLLTIAAEFASRRAEVELLTFRRDDNELPLPPGIRRTVMTERGDSSLLPRSLRVLFGLRRELRRMRPDVAIAFMDQANILTLLAAAGTRIPVVVSERADPSRTSLLEPHRPALIRWIVPHVREILYRRAARVVVQTEGAAKRFSTGLQSNIAVIPNPVFEPRDEEPDIKLPERCIVGIGRLHPQKRFDLLIDAFAAISHAHPDWHLAIIGTGRLREELIRRVESHGLSGRILLPGATATQHATLRQARLFALSSDYEGFPNALCEAMACGLPVVATDCEFGPTEIIRDGLDGVLVPAGVANALAGALDQLIRSEQLRATLGARAAEVVSRFAPGRIFDRWWRLAHDAAGRAAVQIEDVAAPN